MNKTRNRTMIIPVLAGVFICVLGDLAAADSLRAELIKQSFLLYEPIAVQVTLQFDEPFSVDWTDSEKAMKQLQRLPRRLYAELRDSDGNRVSRALLGGVEFEAPENPSQELTMTGLGFFGMPKNPEEAPQDMEPGRYTIVVLNKANRMESNDIAVELVGPDGRDARAVELFRSSLPTVGALIFLNQKGKTSAMSRVEELARDYPETIYGKYAVVSLALMRYQETRAEHNIKGGATVWGPVANDLASVEALFTGKHPLREMVLFRMASARVCSGDYAGARKNLAILKKTFPHGKLGSKSEAFEKEITQIEKQKRSEESDKE